MINSYVCRQCRTRLAQRVVPLQRPQWQQKASFISLRKARPADASQENPEATPPQASTGAGDEDRIYKQRSDGYYLKRLPIGNNKRNNGGGRYSRFTGSETDKLETGEHDKARTGTESKIPLPSTRSESRIPQSQTTSYAVSLDKHLKDANLAKAWIQFRDAYTSKDCPALVQPSSQDIIQLNGGRQRGQNVFGRLLSRVVFESCKGTDSPVSPTVLLFKYEQLGIAQVEFWRDTIGTLTNQALMRISGVQLFGQNLEELLTELLSLWRLYFQFKGEHDVPLDSIDTEWKSMPDPETLKTPIGDWAIRRDVCMRLQHYYPRSTANPVLGFSAIVLFNILNESTHNTVVVSDALRTQSIPFSKLMAHILAGGNVQSVLRNVEISHDLKSLPKDFRSTLIEEIKETPSNAMLMVGARGFTDPSAGAAGRAASLEEYLLKRIARATIEQSEPRRLEKLWKQAVRVYTKDGKTSIPGVIYNAFLTGYLKLLAADRSVEVWNHMVQHGIQPDVRTWTAVIDGCAKARDLNGMNATWTRMIKSGTQPDAYAWASRIHGLFSHRNLNEGFVAMDQMGKNWRAAEQAVRNPAKGGKGQTSTTKPTNNYPKPTIEVINAATSAISGLAPRSLSFTRKVEDIHKILQWASNFGLKPDARTYNILLGLYLKNDDYQTAFTLLRQMESEGIEADMATYTMLVRASFDSHGFSNLSEAEQTSRMLTLFSDLEAGGLTLNTYIYSSTIDRLLKHYSNFSAVRAVIDHMMTKNITPNPHMYTSLISHYFQETPPNVPAVDSLMYQIFSTPGIATDKVLFDRVIEGYANAGAIGKMMATLVRMGSHGKLPGWPALTAVLRALIDTGDWVRARNIVRDVSVGEGVAKQGITGSKFGQQDFFELVRASGLLEEHQQQGEEGQGGSYERVADDTRREEIQEMVENEEVQDIRP